MSLRSLLSALRDKWSGRVPSRRRAPIASRQSLLLEALERRDLMAVAVPKVLAVVPADYSTVGPANPTISVTFSEAMDPADITNANNYLLFNSEGQAITVNTPVANATDTQVTVPYNGGAALPADTYTLFIRGDKVHDSTDTFTLALPGQLVVANEGNGAVSTLNAGTTIPATGTTPYFFGAVHSYPVFSATGASERPVGIVAQDFNGDGNLDVAVANAGSDEIDVYAGNTNGVYSSTPTLRVALPAGSNPVAMIAFDPFGGVVGTDLAVLDSKGNVDVLLNNSTATNIGFKAATAYGDGATNGSALTIGDFDGDGRTDIAVADNADNGGKYNISVLPGNGNGTFQAAQVFQEGADATAKTPTIGTRFPTSIAAGNLGDGAHRDIAVGGLDGIAFMDDSSTGPGNFQFITPLTNFGSANLPQPSQTIHTFGSVSHLAIGYIRATAFGSQDVVATTTADQLDVYSPPTGLGIGYTNTATQTTSGAATGLALRDLGNGETDILITTQGAFANSPATNGSAVGVVVNVSAGTTVSLTAEQDYGVDNGPVALDTGDVDGDGNVDVLTANTGAPSFTVVRGHGDGTLIQATTQFSGGTNPVSIAVGDVNGDGIPDLVVADNATNDVSVFLGDGAGGYSAPITYSTLDASGIGSGPVKVILADLTGKFFNNDPTLPILDIVTADSADNVVSVLANDGLGDGAFGAATTVKTGVGPTDVVAADFNKDGHIDLAVSHDSPGAVMAARGVTLLFGNGDGTFQTGREILPNIQPTHLLAGDFFVDANNAPDLVVYDAASGDVLLERGDGLGNFTTVGTYRAAPDVTALAAADINRDGYLDVIAVSGSTSSTQQITTLLSTVGTGFRPPISTSMPLNMPLNSVAVTDITSFNANSPTTPLDYDAYPDLVVGSVQGESNGATFVDNLWTLTGNGDGSFRDPVPYEAGGEPSPAVVAVASDPLIRLTSFHLVTPLVAPNLIRNGNFEKFDLSNEQGNLTGWQTAALPNSRGSWGIQTGALSPLSQTVEPVPGPPGKGVYRAMLDEANLQPITDQGFNDNPSSSYIGSNFLYQDVSLPAAATSIALSLDLLIDSQGNAFTNPAVNPSLDYRVQANDYQVRVDILDASDTNLADTTVGAGHVLMKLFFTNQNTASFLQQTITADLSAFAGKTIRLRIAAVTNTGQLIVGVDNVSITPSFTETDTSNLSLSGPQLRNLGFVTNIGSGTGNQQTTTDPTLVGQVGDIGSATATTFDLQGNPILNSMGQPAQTFFPDPNNVAFVAFDLDNGNFTGSDIFKTDFFDANGDFSLTLPNLSFGVHTINVRVEDKAGNYVDSSFTFDYEGPSITNWQAVGPGSIDVSTVPGLQFQTVSGRITSEVVDPNDPTGNTYFVGTANGGIWKTTDGGNDWTPLTDYVTNAAGQAIAVPVGGLALYTDPTSKNTVLYAGLGVGDDLPDSQAGFGVLVSTNDGASWSVAGNSGTVLANARITKVAIAPPVVNASNQIVQPAVIYVAVASGGEFGAGVYRSSDNGQTWVDVLSTAATASAAQLANNMQKSGAFLANGTVLASVTDLIVDPANSNDVLIGLGNIGLTGVANATAGLWFSSNQGNSWQAMLGGNNPAIPNATVPSGVGVGRVTIAEAPRKTTDIATYYVLVGNPPSTPPVSGGFVNYGTYTPATTVSGLYKSSDAGQDWTKVQLDQAVTPPPGVQPPLYDPIDLLSRDASNAGALAVDPTNPNVVYVGGAVQDYADPSVVDLGLEHGLIRVDTGDMMDAGGPGDTHFVFNNTVINNGDDYEKYVIANTPVKQGGFGGVYPTGVAYTGEGVAWYDLSQNTANSDSNTTDRLPADVTALLVDAQGRLVIGTEQGIYRAVYHGTGYDYTSGGKGILTYANINVTQPTSSVQITDINGNLQIADLSSVALDPLVPGQIYSTQWGTGAAVTSGTLNWDVSQLRNPLSDSNAGLAQGGGDGDVVLAAAPDPNASAGALATVYELFAYNQGGFFAHYQLVSSVQGGQFGTFSDLPTAGLSVKDLAGYDPVMALYPQKVFNQGKYQDELLLGTDRIYTTETGAAQWDDTVGHALSPTVGAVVTAAAFAPTTPPDTLKGQYIYAATSDGKLFVTTNSGADNWPERDAGLPVGGTITSIVVDANSPLIAFVTVNGGPAGSGHVYETKNGGVSWTNIGGAGSGLPNVNAYSLVEDPRAQPASGAPNGRIYVGTQTGVYVSTDDKTWTRLGAGLPNVPVISLAFNSTLDELVAGTDGRGAFMISTDRVGAHVVSVSPATPLNSVQNSLSAVTVTFNKAISSFPLSAVIHITGPDGRTIVPVGSPINVSTALPGLANPQTTWQITIPTQTLDGIYTFTIGPNILDLTGNQLDQNQNGVNGEIPGDQYTFTVVLNGTDDGQFVSGLYQSLLHRPADTVGFENILAPIDAAQAGLLSAFATAYIQQLGATKLVADLYSSPGGTPFNPSAPLSIIGVGDLYPRAATSGEIAYWNNLLQSGESFEQIIVAITSDPGYFAQNRTGHVVNNLDANFVAQIYQDLFNRAPVASEDQLFVSQLSGAESTARTQDARTLLSTDAYRTQVITADYNQFLHRSPTTGPQGEISFWLAELKAGVTNEQLIASLLSSPEYFNNIAPAVVGGGATPSNDTWVRAAYLQLFPGYPMSANELVYWDGLLNSGSVNLDQAGQILDTSALYRFGAPNTSWKGIINGFYESYMGKAGGPGRAVTQGELNVWAATYAANPGLRDEDIIAAILGSPEYLSYNAPPVSSGLPAQDAAWADGLYTSVFGGTNATAEAADINFLAGAEMQARANVATAIVTSPEFKNDVTTYAYEKYLGRLPAASELALWQPIVGQRAAAPGGLNGDEQLLQAIFSSPEYFLRQSDAADGNLHTENGWLTSLYGALRIPFNDPGVSGTFPTEAAELGNFLADYAPVRLNAIHMFTTSAEYRNDFVTAQYNLFLNRAPVASELTYWQGQFQAGVTQEAVIASLLGSPEYLSRTPTILGVSGAPSNDTFVRAAYKQLFPNYSVSQKEVTYWDGQLNSGALTRQQVANLLDTSPLYRFGTYTPGSTTNPATALAEYQNGFINRMYLALLGRNAAQSEIDYWYGVYVTKPTFRTEDFIASILDSTPYFETPHTIP